MSEELILYQTAFISERERRREAVEAATVRDLADALRLAAHFARQLDGNLAETIQREIRICQRNVQAYEAARQDCRD